MLIGAEPEGRSLRIQGREMELQVVTKALNILFKVRIFQHVMATKGRHGFHAEKAKIQMSGEKKIIHAAALKEILLWILKGLRRCVES